MFAVLRNLGVVEKKLTREEAVAAVVFLKAEGKEEEEAAILVEVAAPNLSELCARRPARRGSPAFSGAVTKDLIFFSSAFSASLVIVSMLRLPPFFALALICRIEFWGVVLTGGMMICQGNLS